MKRTEELDRIEHCLDDISTSAMKARRRVRTQRQTAHLDPEPGWGSAVRFCADWATTLRTIAAAAQSEAARLEEQARVLLQEHP